uniref:Ubiquitin-like domain-containing protein n=1 Tax=Panagrellus redivivus TaxID=6233 RepID=A0A7E4UU50_PANRE
MSPGSISRNGITSDSGPTPDYAAYYRGLKAELRKKHDSNLILVVPIGKHAYLMMSGDVIFFNDVDTPESAAHVFSQCIPPECKTTVVIIVDYDKVELRRRYVQTLQDAGYRNMETIDARCMNLYANISSLTLDCAIGEPVFVNFSQDLVENFVHHPLYVIQKREDGWQLIDTLLTPAAALTKYPSTRHVVIHKDASEAIQREVKALFPVQQLHLSETIQLYEFPFVTKRACHADLKGSGVFPFCYVDLFVQFGDKSETISLNERVTPFTFTKEVDIGDTSVVTVRAFSHGKFKSTTTDKTLTFKNSAFRKVSVTVNVDKNYATEVILRTASTYKPVVKITETGNSLDAALSQLKLDPSPKTVLTFTSDNRLLIEAGKTYTGDKEILAYVRLQSGKSSEVGQHAFTALKTHPGSVFYDITRLLATDFDPDHPDLSRRRIKGSLAKGGLLWSHGEMSRRQVQIR